MSVQTVTDMRTFEGALDEQWCHTIREEGGSFCGLGPDMVADHEWAPTLPDGRCAGCGKPSCPECDRLDAEAM